jgi:hypothetical protein
MGDEVGAATGGFVGVAVGGLTVVGSGVVGFIVGRGVGSGQLNCQFAHVPLFGAVAVPAMHVEVDAHQPQLLAVSLEHDEHDVCLLQAGHV